MTYDSKHKKHGTEPWVPKMLLVLSSMSPLFLLWAIRGTTLMSSVSFWFLCGVLFVGSNLYLLAIITRSRAKVGKRTIEIGSADDRRQDVISYLLAMLLPFYTVDLNSWRNFVATVVAFLIVVVLFTSLDLHFLNLWIAIFGYHCFQVAAPTMANAHPRGDRLMLITKRSSLYPGQHIIGHPISTLVLLEE